jgi:hypothetical protein
MPENQTLTNLKITEVRSGYLKNLSLDALRNQLEDTFSALNELGQIGRLENPENAAMLSDEIAFITDRITFLKNQSK